MIGIWAAHAETFLLIFAIVTTIGFAIPIFFKPLTWAKMMHWNVPEDTDLAVYFGRSLGGFIIVVEWLMFQAALTGNGVLLTMQFVLGVTTLMLLVHVYGAIKKIQPFTETLEIGLWSVLIVLSLAFMPIA